MPKTADGHWICPTCGKNELEHSLALVIEHIYGGVPSTSGRNFDREESTELANRVIDRLRD